jgi:hypothetical protein
MLLYHREPRSFKKKPRSTKDSCGQPEAFASELVAYTARHVAGGFRPDRPPAEVRVENPAGIRDDSGARGIQPEPRVQWLSVLSSGLVIAFFGQ